MPDLEIVDPTGLVLSRTGLDQVVVRRREAGFAEGSEVAILPGHAPMLMQTCACQVRWRRGERTWSLPVGGGVLEVLDDRVMLAVTQPVHSRR